MDDESEKKQRIGDGDGGEGDGACGIYRLGDYLLHDIISRLPAAPFAAACATSPTFRRVGARVLNRPKLVSALSMNPSAKDAVEEIFHKLLSEPIRPHFAIIIFHRSYHTKEPFDLIKKRLGKGVPMICYRADGIVGKDVGAGELYKEVRDWNAFGQGVSRGILVTLGFVPGLKVGAIPMAPVRKKAIPGRPSEMDSFCAAVRGFTLSVSASYSPSAVLMVGTQNVDTRLVVEKMDLAFNERTVIAGVKRCEICDDICFTSGRENIDRETQEKIGKPVLVALVFCKDKSKPPGIGKIHFSVALSTALVPIGISFKARSVKVSDELRDGTLLKGLRVGCTQGFNGPEILYQAEYEVQNDDDKPNYQFYCGVLEQQKFSFETRDGKIIRHFNLHPVDGDADDYHMIVRGHGIYQGDRFTIYAPSLEAITKSHKLLDENFKEWNETGTPSWNSSLIKAQTKKDEVFGGLMFSCILRDSTFFGDAGKSSFGDLEADVSIFTKNFRSATLAGTYGAGEIARSFSTDVKYPGSCYVHHSSSVYLLMSYSPPL